ncbi:MAG: tryptophan 7-halogenase [Hyphomicrobiales bacterium]
MDLRRIRKIVVVGGGTAGWLSSFFMRALFPTAEIAVLDSSSLGILGAGEGTFRNFPYFLERFDIPEPPFMSETSATLITRSVAMRSGWMWMIPTADRLGCGYVYSDAYANESMIQCELEEFFNRRIELGGLIHMKSGCLNRVWIGNCMAVGLAAGFVEPLEATSIGQSIAQLDEFLRVAGETGGVVSETQAHLFNHGNSQSFELVRDFLAMHSPSKRRDSAFWRDQAERRLPPRGSELVAIYRERFPRYADFGLHTDRPQIHFQIFSIASIAHALRLLSRETAQMEIDPLTDSARRTLERLAWLSC